LFPFDDILEEKRDHLRLHYVDPSDTQFHFRW